MHEKESFAAVVAAAMVSNCIYRMWQYKEVLPEVTANPKLRQRYLETFRGDTVRNMTPVWSSMTEKTSP